MSKKNFSGGLSSLLGEATGKAKVPAVRLQKPGPGRPKTSTRVVEKTSQEGTREGETRATFIVKEDSLEKLKAIAYWDRIQIKEVLSSALSEYLERYEKKHGKVKTPPKK